MIQIYFPARLKEAQIQLGVFIRPLIGIIEPDLLQNAFPEGP